MPDKATAEKIKVAVRVRQLNQRECGYKNSEAKWTVGPTMLSHPPLTSGGDQIQYRFGDMLFMLCDVYWSASQPPGNPRHRGVTRACPIQVPVQLVVVTVGIHVVSGRQQRNVIAT